MEREIMTTGFKNSSYVFIPFRYENRNDFCRLIAALDKNPAWEPVAEEIMYMLKYVADKFDRRNPDECQCFHYSLKDAARQDFGLLPASTLYATAPHPFRGDSVPFAFSIHRAELYCFSTSVCILALNLQFTETDPLWVSTALYYLKKVSQERICAIAAEGKETTLLNLAKDLTATLLPDTLFDFFFYTNSGTERANVLTYLDVESKKDYAYELYYLKRCYNEGFAYTEKTEEAQFENFCSTQNITWGISPEAAVCLACPQGCEEFIHGTFYQNFNHQYLFMYVLLLHQKYVLYMLLTKIGLSSYNQLETLAEYQHQLFEFETDFVFSCVTEVPQYQMLYDRLAEAFSLKKMFEDVREPLASLSEIRRTASENKQRERDHAVNRSLFMLSLLTFFSALIDSFDFAESFFSWFFRPPVVKGIQIGSMILVVLAFVYVIKNLISSRKN